MLSNPLTVYAIAVALAFLLWRNRPAAAAALLVLAASGLVFAMTLFVSGTADSFWQSVIVFNRDVYSKYSYAEPLRLLDLGFNALSGLGIFQPGLYDLNPFRAVALRGLQLDDWLFTGFLYRFAILVYCGLLLARRKFSSAAFLYLFAAAVMVIGRSSFRAQPLVLTALFALSAALTAERAAGPSRFWSGAERVARITLLILVTWMSFRFLGQTYSERENLSYSANFRDLEKRSTFITTLACGQSGVFLADYPTGIYSYWFTDLAPASRYLFLWPWVAEIGQQEVIAQLSQEQFAIVLIENGVVWETYDTRDYLRPLNDFLSQNYHRVRQGVYISPQLFVHCGG